MSLDYSPSSLSNSADDPSDLSYSFSSLAHTDCDDSSRLGSQSPFRTILQLSSGPLISQILQACYALADTLWVAWTIGKEGIAVYGAIFIVEFLAMNVANYLMSGLSIRLSYLSGEGRSHESSQIFVDFIRVAFLLGLVVPSIVLPITKPLVIWFGADSHLAEMCFQYMLPVTLGCFFNFLYTMSCGVLQAEGRSLLYGLIQLGGILANMLIFDPLFLVALKLPIWSASLATILSSGLLGIALTLLILFGKFSLSPNFRMFLVKPSSETFEALRVGFGSFIANLSFTLPTILLQKWVNEAAIAIGKYDTVISVWAVIEKWYQLVGGVCIGFSYGLLPSASFAWGANRLNRVFWLFVHSTAVATVCSTVLALVIVIWPRQIASLWDGDSEFLDWSERLIPKAFYTTVFVSFQYTGPGLLQSLQKVAASSFLSVATFLLPLPVFSTILYVTNKEDPERILLAYVMNDAWSFIACVFFLWAPLRLLIAAPKDETLKIEGGRVNREEGEQQQQQVEEGGGVMVGVGVNDEQPPAL
jgi:Na+-driven multidrug efflux pump